MADEKVMLYYDLPDICSRPVSAEEIKHLYDMFSHPGWKIFLELKTIDAKAAAIGGLDEMETGDTRRAYRSAWAACVKDLGFEQKLGEALNGEVQRPLKEIEVPPIDNDFNTIPLRPKKALLGKFIKKIIDKYA